MRLRNRKRLLVALAFVSAACLPVASRAAERIHVGRGEELHWRLPLEEKLRKSISFDFQDAPLEDVLDFFRTSLLINIVVDPRVLTEERRLISLRLADVEAGRGLQWVMTLTGLRYGFRHGAVYVATAARVRAMSTKYFQMYDVRDLTRSAARRGGGGGGDDDDDGGGNGDDNGNGGSGGGALDLVRLLVTLTGRENWKSATVLGGGGDRDDTTNGGDEF